MKKLTLLVLASRVRKVLGELASAASKTKDGSTNDGFHGNKGDFPGQKCRGIGREELGEINDR